MLALVNGAFVFYAIISRTLYAELYTKQVALYSASEVKTALTFCSETRRGRAHKNVIVTIMDNEEHEVRRTNTSKSTQGGT